MSQSSAAGSGFCFILLLAILFCVAPKGTFTPIVSAVSAFGVEIYVGVVLGGLFVATYAFITHGNMRFFR
jgi:hypothetical protein